jgi:UDP-N-acetylmuramoyl-L-alanyl-D-glutamate--2,6-diaminopimelate ligase
MGKAACMADLAIITSTTRGRKILSTLSRESRRAAKKAAKRGSRDLMKPPRGDGYVIEPDRGKAIFNAINICAKPGDVLIIAGKGAEDYQIIGTEKRRFDDREEARKALFEKDGEFHA